MSYRTKALLNDTTAQEEFLSNLELNMGFIEQNLNELPNEDIEFAKSMIDYYKKFDVLTAKQIPWATCFWQELNAMGLG